MRLDQIRTEFIQNFETRGELGASVSVWKDGEEVLNLADGWCEREREHPWTAQTMVPFYSATKALASATLLLLLEENGLTPDDLVCRVWSHFPQKSATFTELMSHQCGLAALDQRVDVFDYESVITAIEQQQPNWALGSGHGYHPRTFGFLVEQPVRLLTGQSLGDVFRERIAKPLGLDLWIGLPENEFDRVARLYPGKMQKHDLENGFYKEFNHKGTLVQKAFTSPHGLQGVHEMNTPKAWAAGFPAMGGVGTAQSLAKFYQAAIGSISHFAEDVLTWMKTPVIQGEDKVLMTPTRFSCGFQLDPLTAEGVKIRQNYGKGVYAFGHPGAGGSHAFGDPEKGVSYAYVMNQMNVSVLPEGKSLSLVSAL